MQPKTTASSSTGHHCAHVIRCSGGRATGSSTAAATHWRTATTPAGPTAAKACVPTAAPTWLATALPVIVAMPRSDGRGCPATSSTPTESPHPRGSGGNADPARTHTLRA